MLDHFEDRSSGLESPAFDGTAVTPNNSVDLAVMSRALYIGSSGDLSIVTAGGTTLTFRNVPIGLLPIRVSRMRATGTTASDIVAVW